MKKHKVIMAKCTLCGNSFDAGKRHYPSNKQALYCGRECRDEARRQSGFFQWMGKLGNAAQAQYKTEHGKAPGTRGGVRPRQKVQE